MWRNEELHNFEEMIGDLESVHTGITAGARLRPAARGTLQTRHPGSTWCGQLGYYKWAGFTGRVADREYQRIRGGDFVLG